MPVNRIRRVRIRPGNQRVTVMLDSDRFRFARPALSWSDLWEIPLYLVSLISMLVFVSLGVTVISMDFPVLGGLLVLVGVVVGAPILFAMLADAAVFVVFPALLIAGLVMMLTPAGRRKWRQLWTAKPDEPDDLPYFEIAALSIESEWNRTTVVMQRRDGEPIGMVATGVSAHHLRRALPDVPLPRTILRRNWRVDPRFRHLA